MDNKSKLSILWTNADPVTSEIMVFMYAKNALLNNWWDEVTIIIWGATAKLIGENRHIQEGIKDLLENGVNISACKACTDQLGVSDILTSQGIEVKYWGEPLTEILKRGEKLLTI